jgi:uncharacterized membrane protein YgdD (TMEM256/DUF423 family)
VNNHAFKHIRCNNHSLSHATTQVDYLFLHSQALMILRLKRWA